MIDPPVKPPIATAPLSAVLIAYEPGPDLPALIAEWKAVLDRRGTEYEIIVVDDSGAESPAPTESEPPPDDPRVRVLRHETRRGFGAALRTGVAAAVHPLLFYTTADRQYQPDDLKLLLDHVDTVDLVSGFRQWQSVPFWLRAVGAVWRLFLLVFMGVAGEKKACWLGWPGERQRLLTRFLFGFRGKDPNCAFRLFRREVFDRFPIQSDGAFAQAEIMAKANFLAWMAEVSVRYAPVTGAAATYCKEWDRAELWRVLSDPEFRPPAPPPETPAPAPEAVRPPEPVGEATPSAPPPLS
jgi:glycosyltransferase involved in cell wall biosynthesis